MDSDIALILLQDGVVNGAIYALMALALVLVFAVTRVILIPQGELVAFSALSYAALNEGRAPGSVWLLAGLGVAAFLMGLLSLRHAMTARATLALAVECLLLPAAVSGLVLVLAPGKPPLAVQALLAVAIVTPMAPLLYRIVFQPMAEASVLVLLIAAVGVHLALVGLGLVVFGPEGSRASALLDTAFNAGPLFVQGQAVLILLFTALLIAALALFFGTTLAGKALRATAVNRLGAQLVGIGTSLSGRVAFSLAGLVGAAAGVLISPLTTVYYDTGFLIGLKGFVAAIIGGLVSYPAAALAAVLVGVVESVSSFYASAFKEVIVFAVIIPVLLWRSLRSPQEDEE